MVKEFISIDNSMNHSNKLLLLLENLLVHHYSDAKLPKLIMEVQTK